MWCEEDDDDDDEKLGFCKQNEIFFQYSVEYEGSRIRQGT